MLSSIPRFTVQAFAILLVISTQAWAQKTQNYDEARRKLVNEVLVPSGIKNDRVLKAVLDTPRHEFCLPQYREQAYYDMGLPIGESQTISSPFIVAYMTESLDPQPTDKVLEIGTGSGYQAAILSPLVKDVYTIEIVENLGKKAAKTLEKLRYRNVHTKIGDGYQGWTENAPFDKIIVTCSPEKPPQPLIDQLKEGGLMIVPTGERYQQTLYLLKKQKDKLETVALKPTLFVPMTGRAEDSREVLPDPSNPKIVNGDFEAETKAGDSVIPGWYYERQHELIHQETGAPQGKQFVRFKNQVSDRPAHISQGFPIDGRKISSLDFSFQASCKDVVVPPNSPQSMPSLDVMLFDDGRKMITRAHIAPIKGTQPWKRYDQTVKVPLNAREAIICVGLYGAVGEASFDDISIRPVPRK